MASIAASAISAPGKVLLCGGYLVVDREYTGLVLGLSARIHVHIQDIPTPEGVSLSEIVVQSPQFRFAEWRYSYRLTEGDRGVGVVQLKGYSTSDQPRNKFVETALRYALTYISSFSFSHIKSAAVTILADADYYSHADTATPNEKNPTSRFQDFNVALSDAHKTGLGSSAALVSSFVGAILRHFLPKSVFDLSSAEGRKRVHNLAQAAHCHAQGKVGSGFDVAAAVFGSCVYRRFSPSVLEVAGDPDSQSFVQRLAALVNDDDGQTWDTEIRENAVQMPEGLKMVMCDVDCGSETPSMVKQVFAWRKENPEDSKRIWDTLQEENDCLALELKGANKAGLKNAGTSGLKQSFQTCRQLIREMSSKSGVPIEPPVQTDLLDACGSVPGVVGGVVPGAGGYDALVLIIEDRPEVQKQLEELLAGYKPKTQQEGPQIGKVKLLNVTQEMEGIKSENHDLYLGWV